MIAMRGLLEPLAQIQASCIHTARFETAVVELLDGAPGLLETRHPNSAHLITNHVVAHLSMLRDLAREEAIPVSCGRKFVKTGGLQYS
jgi:hypothetical protein